METKTKRKERKDRTNALYSEQDFMQLPKASQLELAIKYWERNTAEFDDSGLFKFSYTHFAKLCERLDFAQGVVDTLENVREIRFERSWSDSKEKKFTLASDTVSEIDQIFDKLNVDVRTKAHIIDVVIFEAFNTLNKELVAGGVRVIQNGEVKRYR